MKIGFRASKNIDISRSNLRELVTTSEANQLKIHFPGTRVATGSNQTFTTEHGLTYTPLFDAFIRSSGNAYYQPISVGGNTFADKNSLSIQTSSSGDIVTFIIFKDFGA